MILVRPNAQAAPKVREVSDLAEMVLPPELGVSLEVEDAAEQRCLDLGRLACRLVERRRDAAGAVNRQPPESP
jgi:hypothetical protein